MKVRRAHLLCLVARALALSGYCSDGTAAWAALSLFLSSATTGAQVAVASAGEGAGALPDTADLAESAASWDPLSILSPDKSQPTQASAAAPPMGDRHINPNSDVNREEAEALSKNLSTHGASSFMHHFLGSVAQLL